MCLVLCMHIRVCVCVCVCVCVFVWSLVGFWLQCSPGGSQWKAEVWMTYLFKKNPPEMASMLLCCHILAHVCVCVCACVRVCV